MYYYIIFTLSYTFISRQVCIYSLKQILTPFILSSSSTFVAILILSCLHDHYVYDCFILDASLSAGQITAMGISTQRSTFITWSRKNGQPFHRFCTWKDLRADKLVKEWNNSYTWKVCL